MAKHLKGTQTSTPGIMVHVSKLRKGLLISRLTMEGVQAILTPIIHMSLLIDCLIIYTHHKIKALK